MTLAGGVLKKQGMWLFIIACEIIESMTLYIALARDYTYIGGRRGEYEFIHSYSLNVQQYDLVCPSIY